MFLRLKHAGKVQELRGGPLFDKIISVIGDKNTAKMSNGNIQFEAERVYENGDLITYKAGEHTVHIKYNDIFDRPSGGTEYNHMEFVSSLDIEYEAL